MSDLPDLLPNGTETLAGTDVSGWVCYKIVRWYRPPENDGRCIPEDYIDTRTVREPSRRGGEGG